MRSLQIHCSKFEYEPLSRAVEGAEEIEVKGRRSFGDCLVSFITVEGGDLRDPGGIGSEAADSIGEHARMVKTNTIVVYPYAHLSSSLATAEPAKKVLEEVASKLAAQGFEVHRAPFGWYKAFNLVNRGHPLAELSRTFVGKEGPLVQPEGKDKFIKFYIIDAEGREHEITPDNWKSKTEIWDKGGVYKLLWTFVRNELEGRPPSGESPKHIEYMRRLELLDYAPESDVGHMKWYPGGVLIKDLITDYALKKIALPWGAVKIQNPIIYRTDVESIKKLQGEFHERDYILEEEGKEFVLRFASDPGAFPFVQRTMLTYRQMPFRVYEEAICFRKEQRGELTGLIRVRNFWMTDQHAFCTSEEQALEEYRKLSVLFARLMRDTVAGEHWVLGFEIVEDFYEKYRGFFSELMHEINVPAFFKLMKEMTHYYAFKNEGQCIFSDGNNVQVSTVQWDVKNGERFGIGYVDKEGRRRSVPFIIHASSFGSIERSMASLLENAEWMKVEGKQPMLPVWLSPEQVRIIPLNPGIQLAKSVEIAQQLEENEIRVGVDDRDMSLSKRVMEAKRHWIPYLVVIGETEMKSDELPVTVRKDAKLDEDLRKKMTVRQLMDEIKRETEGMPFRRSYLPTLLSMRPIFVGG